MTMTQRTADQASGRVRMDPLRRTAAIVGWLFVLTYVTSIASKFALYPPLTIWRFSSEVYGRAGGVGTRRGTRLPRAAATCTRSGSSLGARGRRGRHRQPDDRELVVTEVVDHGGGIDRPLADRPVAVVGGVADARALDAHQADAEPLGGAATEWGIWRRAQGVRWCHNTAALQVAKLRIAEHAAPTDADLALGSG